MIVDVPTPVVGESVATVYMGKFHKQVGDSVTMGETVFEIDSDKASMEVPAPVSGVVREILAAEGDEVPIETVVMRIEEGASAEASTPAAPAPAAAAPEPKAPAAAKPAAAPAASGESPKAGPAARVAAKEGGVALGGIAGSGPAGRITSEDVSRAVAQGGQPAPKPPAAASAPSTTAIPAGDRVIERVKMTPLRRTIARRLVEAQHNAAMLTTFNEVDMSAVMDMRKQIQDRFVARHGIKLGFMSFFVKACVEGLKQFPAVNAEVGDGEFLFKRYYNIGVAVSGPKGLVVPVLRDADRLSFAQTEAGIGELAKRARDNKLVPEDFQDGTFTISNGGVFGSMMSTPILNPPQVAILGMHNIVQRPVAVEGRVEIHPMMYLALSYDHRIIDGREAVSFLVRVKECIEAPERMLLEA